MLGGVIGLSIVTSVFLRSLRHNLMNTIPALQVDALLDRTDAIEFLPEAVRAAVRFVIGHRYNV